MKKIRISDNILLYQGDCYEIIPFLPKHKITLIHTDPPYDYIGRLGETSPNVGNFMTKIGYKKSQEKLTDDVKQGFNFNSIFQFQELLAFEANFQFWCNKRQVFNYLSIANEKGWNWQDICLYRNNALPNVRGKYQDKDYCLHLWKGRSLTGQYKNKRTDYHWSIGRKKEWNHPCLKPTEPIVNLLEVGSNEGDIVLDPFMGSGTTGEACFLTNRLFIGIEKNPEYFDMAVKRLSELKKSLFEEIR